MNLLSQTFYGFSTPCKTCFPLPQTETANAHKKIDKVFSKICDDTRNNIMVSKHHYSIAILNYLIFFFWVVWVPLKFHKKISRSTSHPGSFEAIHIGLFTSKFFHYYIYHILPMLDFTNKTCPHTWGKKVDVKSF